jgi:hypothetical protein
MCCQLIPLLLLFNLPFYLYSTTLVRRTSNCADANACLTRRGSIARGLVWEERNLAFWSASGTTNLLERSGPARKSAAAMSSRKHAKLRRPSPGGRGAAPPSPPPTNQSVSPSSETGERSAEEVYRGSLSVTDEASVA